MNTLTEEEAKTKMKLYIWADPYPVKYGTSMLLAVAENEDEARLHAKHAPGFIYVQYARGVPRNTELGPPTRVIDLPCAEWHEWSE